MARHRTIPADARRRVGHLFVISAPSGAGKTSLISALVESDPSLQVSISHTTRPRRKAEVDGVHYHFVRAATFDAMCRAGDFLEWAVVYGYRYGTAHAKVGEALIAGRDVILEIDWQGAQQVCRSLPHAVAIFLLPPSIEALTERLRGRGQDAAQVIANRTAQAVEDISHYDEFDYLVVNDDFDTALAALRRIVAAVRAGETPPSEDHSALLDRLLPYDEDDDDDEFDFPNPFLR